MSNNPLMITSDLARAARALTQVSAKVIARNAGLDKQQVRDFEKGNAPLTPEAKRAAAPGPRTVRRRLHRGRRPRRLRRPPQVQRHQGQAPGNLGRRRRHRLRGRHLRRSPHEDGEIANVPTGAPIWVICTGTAGRREKRGCLVGWVTSDTRIESTQALAGTAASVEAPRRLSKTVAPTSCSAWLSIERSMPGRSRRIRHGRQGDDRHAQQVH